MQNTKLSKTIPAPNPWHYRNKAQYQIENLHGKTKLGLFAPNSHRLIDLPKVTFLLKVKIHKK